MTVTPPKMVPRWCQFLLLCVLAGSVSGPAHAQRDASSPEQSLADAVAFYEQQLYPAANTALSEFRTAHPNHPAAPQTLYLQARSALALGDDTQTRRLLDRLQRKYPSHPRAQAAKLGLAQYYLEQGKLGEARSQLQAIATTPNSPQEGARALYLLGRTEQDQGNPAAALPYFKQVYNRYPNANLAPAALYARGVTHVRLEEYDRATAAFERLGERYPDSPFAQNLGTVLGEVYYRLGQYESAAEELQQRLPRLQGPERIRALFLLGEIYNQLGQFEAAVPQYRQVLTEAPESPYATPARYGLAWQRYRSGTPQTAAKAFARVRRTDSPLAQKATYYEAVARTLMGTPKKALQLYDTFLASGPDGRLATEAQYERGLLLYQQERYADAAAAFRAVATNAPTAPRQGDAYYWLGNARLANNELDPALSAYTNAIERDAAPPQVQVEVQFQKAWTLYRNDRYSDAGPAFCSLADAHPNSDRGRDALFWAGDAFYQQGRYGRAQTFFRRYLDTNPEGEKRAGAQYALAWTHFKQRRFEPAARLFRVFLDTYASDGSIPYRQDARLRLADCYFALKRYDDAVAAYQQVEGGDTGTDYALYQAGTALYYADRPTDALNRLRRFTSQYPDSPWRPDALYRIGDIHFQEQQYEDARAAFQRLLNEHPDHPRAAEAQYGIGDTYYNAGQMEDAVGAYRAVLETYPKSPSANEAASSLFFALNAAGQQDRADTLIESIASSAPNTNLGERLRYQRARAAYQRGDSKKALQLFRSFVRTASTQSLIPDAYYYLGLLHADLDQSAEAKNYLSQLVDQHPDSEHAAEASLRLGEIYLDESAYEDALTAYRSAAQSAQNAPELQAQARYGQSTALLQLGRTAAADTLLSRIVDSENRGPLRNAARLGLGRVREEQGRSADALDLYRQVVQTANSEAGAEALYRLGRQLRRQGQAQAAIRELERMPSLFPGYPEWGARALLEQARAYRTLGQTGQAVQLYEQVESTYSGTPYAQTAQTEKEEL